MIKSMTGYGRSEQLIINNNITVEIKSVNHRYSDLNIKIPRYYSFMEDKIRDTLKKNISRGKVDIFISVDCKEDNNKTIYLNKTFADSYIKALLELQELYGLSGKPTLELVASNPDIFKTERLPEDEELLWSQIQTVLFDALADFSDMKLREGERLAKDIINRKNQIQSILSDIEKRCPEIETEYRTKLETKIKDLLDNIPIDEYRILTEVALFSDKVSITEEIVRLNSHLDELEILLTAGGAVGRKLDFLLQEMNRETNTIGSKCTDLYTSKKVVDIKAELEKIREQIQNIE